MKIRNLKLKIVKRGLSREIYPERSRAKSRGFTLIELAVAIGIIVLLTAGSVVGISSARSRRQVKTTAENLRAYLMEARAQAMTPDDTSSGVTKLRLEINTGIDKNAVKLYKVGSLNNLGELTSPKLNIPKGITIAPATNSNMTSLTTTGCFNANPCSYFSFDAKEAATLGQLTDLAPPSSDSATIQVSNSNKSNKYNVTVYRQTGLVEIKQMSP